MLKKKKNTDKHIFLISFYFILSIILCGSEAHLYAVILGLRDFYSLILIVTIVFNSVFFGCLYLLFMKQCNTFEWRLRMFYYIMFFIITI